MNKFDQFCVKASTVIIYTGIGMLCIVLGALVWVLGCCLYMALTTTGMVPFPETIMGLLIGGACVVAFGVVLWGIVYRASVVKDRKSSWDS